VIDTGLNANPNRIGFTGYVLDVEGSRAGNGNAASPNGPIANARYYAKARYYGAGRGSFISVDPWGGDQLNPVSYGKYLYAYNNPGAYTDPDGRCAGPLIVPCLGVIGAELGFFGSVISQEITEGKNLATVDYKRAGTEAVIGGVSGASGAGLVAAGTRTAFAVAGGVATDTLLSTGADAINAPEGEFVAQESLQTNLVVSTAGVFAGTAGGLLFDAGRSAVKQGWKYAPRVQQAGPAIVVESPDASIAFEAPDSRIQVVPDYGSGQAGGNTTRRGIQRRNPSDWRALRDSWDDLGYGNALSKSNRSLIARSRTPTVDDAWVEVFPEDAGLLGEQVRMHHVGGYPITVPLAETRHLDAHMPGGYRFNEGGPGAQVPFYLRRETDLTDDGASN